VALHYDSIEVDLCPQCGGVWLDYDELQQIIGRRHGNAAVDKVSDATSCGAAATISDVTQDIVNVMVNFLVDAVTGL
jgi:Zn-finger nucleic acid-binding protein